MKHYRTIFPFIQAIVLLIGLFSFQPTRADTHSADLAIGLINSAKSVTQNPLLIDSLVPSDGAASDRFGFAMALTENQLAVSAINHDNPDISSGAVYLYSMTNGQLIETQKITPTDTHTVQRFGHRILFHEGQLIVSSERDNELGIQAGAVYVYEQVASHWVLNSKLTASDGAAGDHFGWDMVIAANQLIVSAYSDTNNNHADAGALYVFEKSGGNWQQVDKLTASDGQAGDRFGISLASSQDRMVVGAHTADGAAIDSGAVYLFEFDGASWQQTRRIEASNGQFEDRFGTDLAIDGDTIMVAAQFTDVDGDNTGSVYVFESIDGIWSETQQILATDPLPEQRFGETLQFDGQTLAIGAVTASAMHPADGAVFLYTQQMDTWLPSQSLLPKTAGTDGAFGKSLLLDQKYLLISEQWGGTVTNTGTLHRFVWDNLFADGFD